MITFAAFKVARENFEEGFSFPVDIQDTPEAVLVKAELPGMNKEDIKSKL